MIFYFSEILYRGIYKKVLYFFDNFRKRSFFYQIRVTRSNMNVVNLKVFLSFILLYQLRGDI